MTAQKSGAADSSEMVVGRYRLIRRIGNGSFATVWLGHDDDLDVDVAVKVLSRRWAADDDVRQRFVTEARLMRRISDVRITHVYDIGQLEDGRPYFVMDFADGGSLNEVRRSHPSPVRALRLCAETCRALAVLHEYDVVHRDVTPGNVWLNPGRGTGTRIMIADLGVANDRAAAIGLPMTAGTPGYMAPEQARGEHVDQRADIYSLAALCYAMLTGRPPFGARTLEDVLNRDVDLRPAPIAAGLGAPDLLDTLLAAGLSADPKLRPPTAGLLGEALDRIADDVAARLAAKARAGGGVDSTQTGEGQDDGTFDGGYEAMATMIRPAGAEAAEAPAESVEAPDPIGATSEKGPDPSPVGSSVALIDPDAERSPATTDRPLPLGRYVLLTALGLAVFTVVVLITGYLLR